MSTLYSITVLLFSVLFAIKMWSSTPALPSSHALSLQSLTFHPAYGEEKTQFRYVNSLTASAPTSSVHSVAYISLYSPGLPNTTPPPDDFNMVAHRRGPWSQHEDQWLVNLVARNGPHNWVRISQEIGSRSPKQCRERYHQNLKPSLNHDPITPEEGDLIEKMVAEMGKRWAEIARRLKGRSDNAVKNWWNGGQNRRKRNPERPDQRPREYSQTSEHYQYPLAPQHMTHHDEQHLQSYHDSRRPSSNPPMHTPYGVKLPQPQRFEPYPGSRPQPLELYRQPASVRARGFETPMPSPSGYSSVSADGAPSLITDTGSESRSPRGAASPLDITLAPLVGARDERKNSSTRYLPSTGFAVEDDVHPAAYDPYRRRGSLQLPPLHREVQAPALAFKEPQYAQHQQQRTSLLTQPAPQHVHHHSLPQPSSFSIPQRALPGFHSLNEPVLPLPSTSRTATSPPIQQLPSPYTRPVLPSQTQSAPVSPKDKMSLKNIM
jgi:Myb-like DNA-binding protein FlbD